VIVSKVYMVRLGTQGAHLQECLEGNFIGVDFGFARDFTGLLPDDWKEFNREWVPKWLELHPGKTKVAAGLSCGMSWTVAQGLQKGDLVLSPDSHGNFSVGKVSGPYFYVAEGVLPQRRPVEWLGKSVSRNDMSDTLKKSASVPLTVVDLTAYANEIEGLLGEGSFAPELVAADPTVEDPSVFALEKHLEDFLVANWAQTELGKTYRVYEVDGQIVGRQFMSATGPIDILAVSHDGSELLVVELKRGRASDTVVGQVQRYMGYAMTELCDNGQTVRGVIIALEDDLKLKHALVAAPNIDFYKYEVNFKLHKG